MYMFAICLSVCECVQMCVRVFVCVLLKGCLMGTGRNHKAQGFHGS